MLNNLNYVRNDKLRNPLRPKWNLAWIQCIRLHQFSYNKYCEAQKLASCHDCRVLPVLPPVSNVSSFTTLVVAVYKVTNIGNSRPTSLYACANKPWYLFSRSGLVIGHVYGAGDAPIWLANVICNGTENSLADCWHNGWGIANCGHTEDVSIRCSTTNASGKLE